eukprot:4945496-Prymnesium_polylepis.1
MHLDVGCLKARSVEPSGTLGRRESRASSGLYRTGDTRVDRGPVSSHPPHTHASQCALLPTPPH